jgi:V8-like Glu-specific endopeptidase
MKILSLLAIPLLFITLAAAPQTDTRQHRSTHHIEIETILDDVSCSATSVGPHALLTAGHCDGGTDQLLVDGKKATIVQRIYDHQDHVIYVTSQTYSDYTPIDERDLIPDEGAYMWGNPGHAKDIYRSGYFVKESKEDNGMILQIFVMPIFPGDSGSGVFDEHGKLIAVASLGDRSAGMATFPLEFSPEQLALASK